MKFAYFNPTVMAVDDVPADIYVQLKDIVNLAHNHREHNDAGNQAISVRGGQQIQLLPNQFGQDTSLLKNYVESRCLEYIDRLGQINGITDLDSYQPTLVSAWTIKQSANDYQALHSHEAHISGNIYIETPDLLDESNKSDSCLEFRFPTIKNTSQFVFTDNWQFKPQIMKMVVFPSYIPHTVYPWKGQGSRTILAWDVKLIPKKA
jgi:cAMP phosphodiesterase